MKHSRWYIMQGKAIIIGNITKLKITKLKQIHPIIKLSMMEQKINVAPILTSLRLYNLCPSLKYNPNSFPYCFCCALSFALIISVLLHIDKNDGKINQIYEIKLNIIEAEYLELLYGLTTKAANTMRRSETNILILLADQNFFLGDFGDSGKYCCWIILALFNFKSLMLFIGCICNICLTYYIIFSCLFKVYFINIKEFVGKSLGRLVEENMGALQ